MQPGAMSAMRLKRRSTVAKMRPGMENTPGGRAVIWLWVKETEALTAEPA